MLLDLWELNVRWVLELHSDPHDCVTVAVAMWNCWCPVKSTSLCVRYNSNDFWQPGYQTDSWYLLCMYDVYRESHRSNLWGLNDHEGRPHVCFVWSLPLTMLFLLILFLFCKFVFVVFIFVTVLRLNAFIVKQLLFWKVLTKWTY